MNPVQNAPYLRAQRNFPSESIQALTVEIDKTYVDIANRVNSRVIGIFATDTSAVTGEQWFTAGSSSRQQSLRQVFAFTSAGSIPHDINFNQITNFVKIYGCFTDGTNWYPLPYVDVVSATNQVNLYVTPTNIVITAGAGSPPTITNGTVILEWLTPV